MPIPPRKTPTMRQMLAPKIPADVTETRRQGQGIGDIQAIGQMARTIIPEVLRNAPATSVPMAGYDAIREAGRGNFGAAGLAVLGAIPFGGMMDDAARNAPKAFSALDEAFKAMKQESADMAERIAIENAKRARQGLPPIESKPIVPYEQHRKATDAWNAQMAARNEKIANDLADIDQQAALLKNQHDEAKAWLRAVRSDPNRQPMELEQARNIKDQLWKQYTDMMKSRQAVYSKYPNPDI